MPIIFLVNFSQLKRKIPEVILKKKNVILNLYNDNKLTTFFVLINVIS